jgi:hypothetical protein
MKCINCAVDTTNPKFCGRKCAATYNNKMFPKRRRKRLIPNCSKCGKPAKYRRKLCEDCLSVDWTTVPLGDNLKLGDHARIRAHSRYSYIKAGRPLVCFVCGYSTFCEVCHIEPVSSFPSTATIATVNAQTNLVCLCKNHHWELDHGVLNKSDIQELNLSTPLPPV